LVVDQYAHAEALFQQKLGKAQGDVARIAGSVRNDDAYGARRPRLGGVGRSVQACRGGQACQQRPADRRRRKGHHGTISLQDGWAMIRPSTIVNSECSDAMSFSSQVSGSAFTTIACASLPGAIAPPRASS